MATDCPRTFLLVEDKLWWFPIDPRTLLRSVSCGPWSNVSSLLIVLLRRLRSLRFTGVLVHITSAEVLIILPAELVRLGTV